MKPSLSVVGLMVSIVLVATACTIEQGSTNNDPFDTATTTGGFIKPDIQIDTSTAPDTGTEQDTASTSGGGDTTTGPNDTQNETPDTTKSTLDDTATTSPDVGEPDSEQPDAGAAPDSEQPDAAPEDAAPEDAGPADTGSQDAGPQGCTAADPKSCDDGKACTQDVCDEPTGECAHIPLPAGTPCDGGFVCSAAVCQQNIGCVPSGEKKKCDDGKPCTVDECIEGKGCTSKDGGAAPCDDSNPCTKFDHCKLGKCNGLADDCEDGWPCTKDSCIKSTGCKHELQVNGPCDDGNACTKGTECIFGDCKGPDVPCDDGNSCTKDLCDKKKGCTYIKIDKTACDDGDACTVNTVCTVGLCKGALRDCNDGKSCTKDTCDNKKGCNSLVKKAGATCLLGGSCSSKGICSSMLSCGNGKIDKGEICDDGNKNPCDNCNNTCSGSNVGQKLQGTATVGVGGAYKTINQAISALSTCGVQGPTTFIVLPGTYAESQGFHFPNISTASAKAPITFRADPTGKVKLIGSTSGTSYSGTIRIASGAHDYTIEGFDIDGTKAGNRVKTSHCGVVVFQPSSGQKRITLRRLNIHDFGTSAWGSYSYVAGIYFPNTSKPYEDIRIENNRFTGLNTPNKSSLQGVIFSYYPRFKGLVIEGNYIVANQIYAPMSFYYGHQFDNVSITNNMLEVSYGYALYTYRVGGVNTNAHFAFNTILITNGSYAAYVYYWNYNNGTKGKLVFRNNIVASLSVTKNVAYLSGNTDAFSNAGNNCYFNAKWNYQSSGDVTGNPAFKSLSYPYDLHLTKGSACADKGSLDVPGVTHDFDGDLRSESPDIGADEFK
jgi:cysteine-rich repeat protein